jgi:electron transfer flavoprotein beta subunit
MEIVVCVKRVPETTEAEIIIDEAGKGIEDKGLAFVINEWDNYALEEAILLKEKFGGSVTVVTVGSEESDEILRKCLAMGADRAIRLTDGAFEDSDARATAGILFEAVRELGFDLVLTGVQAGDDGYGQIGVTLAELLGIPHAALVSSIEIEDGTARVHRELEGGLEELLEIKLPAVLTVQTGINQPRYVSIMGIRKARGKEIKTLGLADVDLEKDEVGVSGSLTRLEGMSLPPVGERAEILEGGLEEVSTGLAEILKKGSLI